MTKTIRIAATADSHFNQDSRFDECQRIHDWMVDDMQARGVDLLLHVGDWFERTSKIDERNAVAGFLKRAVRVVRDVMGVRGNHDSKGDLKIFNDIDPNILIEETINVHLAAGCAIATFPWPQKGKLLAGLDANIGHEESEDLARRLMRNLFLGLRDKLAKHHGPRILMMHAQVSGAVTSVGQPLVGCDLEVSLEDLSLCEADLIILGHIHKPQQWTTANGIPVLYCGSPYATTYGEVEEKSYLLAEFDVDVTPASRFENLLVQRIATPRTPMVLIEADYDATAVPPGFRLRGELVSVDADGFTMNLPDPNQVAGADVRFRYFVDHEFADAASSAAADVEAHLYNAGAVAVKVEAVKNSTTRARAPEIEQAQTIREKLVVLWDNKGTRPEPDRAERLLSLAEEIETEYRQTCK